MTRKSFERCLGRKASDDEYLTAELVYPTMSDYMSQDEFCRSFKEGSLIEKMAYLIEDLLCMVNYQQKALEIMNHKKSVSSNGK